MNCKLAIIVCILFAYVNFTLCSIRFRQIFSCPNNTKSKFKHSKHNNSLKGKLKPSKYHFSNYLFTIPPATPASVKDHVRDVEEHGPKAGPALVFVAFRDDNSGVRYNFDSKDNTPNKKDLDVISVLSKFPVQQTIWNAPREHRLKQMKVVAPKPVISDPEPPVQADDNVLFKLYEIASLYKHTKTKRSPPSPSFESPNSVANIFMNSNISDYDSYSKNMFEKPVKLSQNSGINFQPKPAKISDPDVSNLVNILKSKYHENVDSKVQPTQIHSPLEDIGPNHAPIIGTIDIVHMQLNDPKHRQESSENNLYAMQVLEKLFSDSRNNLKMSKDATNNPRVHLTDSSTISISRLDELLQKLLSIHQLNKRSTQPILTNTDITDLEQIVDFLKDVRFNKLNALITDVPTPNTLIDLIERFKREKSKKRRGKLAANNSHGAPSIMMMTSMSRHCNTHKTSTEPEPDDDIDDDQKELDDDFDIDRDQAIPRKKPSKSNSEIKHVQAPKYRFHFPYHSSKSDHKISKILAQNDPESSNDDSSSDDFDDDDLDKKLDKPFGAKQDFFSVNDAPREQTTERRNRAYLNKHKHHVRDTRDFDMDIYGHKTTFRPDFEVLGSNSKSKNQSPILISEKRKRSDEDMDVEEVLQNSITEVSSCTSLPHIDRILRAVQNDLNPLQVGRQNMY